MAIDIPVIDPSVARPSARRRTGRRWIGWGFLAPFFVVFLFTLVAPVVYAVYLSVFEDRLIGGNAFVGLANYVSALTDPAFYSALLRVSLFLVVQVPILLLLSTVAALAIDSGRMFLPRFVRIAVFLPYAVPSVVAALMWGFMYGAKFGFVGDLNRVFGLQIPDLLGGGLILPSIGNVVTWEFLGYNMLILYASLRTVPEQLYEAADIDGASSWQIIRAIKLPAMRPAYVVALIFAVIGSFQLFNEPNVLKTLAPNSISSDFTPNMYAYNLSFAGQQFNYAAAIAILMGIITMIVAYVIQTVGSRRGQR